MDKNEFSKYLIAGLFLVFTLFLAVGMVFTIGKDKGLAQPKIHVYVLFRNIGGLTDGAPVRLSGVNVGTVGNINFLKKSIEGRSVIVMLKILKKYEEQLKTKSHFAIKTEGILGEKLIEIQKSDFEERLDLSTPVIGKDPLEIQDLAQVFTEAARSFTKTSNEMSQIDMMELSRVMEESAKAMLITSEGINGILGQLEQIVNKSTRLLDRIEQRVIDGSLFKVF